MHYSLSPTGNSFNHAWNDNVRAQARRAHCPTWRTAECLSFSTTLSRALPGVDLERMRYDFYADGTPGRRLPLTK